MSVLFISPCYYAEDPKRLPILPVCLIEQSFTDWKLILLHDGPSPPRTGEFIRSLRDPRITFGETSVRQQEYGHHIRDRVLCDLRDPDYFSDCRYVVITNPDNYHAPGFLSLMMPSFNDPKAVACYCEHMAHNYVGWKIMPGHPEGDGWKIDRGQIALGCIDIGQVIFKREVISDIGWPWYDHSSDYKVIDAVRNKYGEQNFKLVKECCLFVHN